MCTVCVFPRIKPTTLGMGERLWKAEKTTIQKKERQTASTHTQRVPLNHTIQPIGNWRGPRGV